MPAVDLPPAAVLMLSLALLAGCASPPTWTVSVLHQGGELLVSLHHNDYPRGPSRVTIDGERLEVRNRGGTTPGFAVGPSAFGPRWSKEAPSYRLPLSPEHKVTAPITLEFEGARVEVADLGERRFVLSAPGPAARPGDELTIRFERGPDFATPWTSGGGLHTFFTPSGGETVTWASSHAELGRVVTLTGGPGRVLHLRVPADAPVGPGKLWINGVMPATILRCDGTAGCNADVVVDGKMDLEVVAP